jgi:hypothetical protein
VFPQTVRPASAANQAREYLLVVFFFDFRLFDNLNAAVKTVGGDAMSQMRFT